MSSYQGDSIFWVEVDRIRPNPYQPRRVFDETALASLAESIRQYGVLQPLTVTRKEIERPGHGIYVEYELVAGERRLRASKLAGIVQVPVVIRTSEDTDRMKLELAIIENLQREDLNAVDRAEAFSRLVNEFGLKHADVGVRVGKSREYVSNTLRILGLPEEMREAVRNGEITEGHTRPLLMLANRPEEQLTLFKDITTRRINVRDAEQLARRVATDRARNKSHLSPDVVALEKDLSEKLGTRVRIAKNDAGGTVTIDFFSPEDLTNLCLTLATPAAPVGASADDVAFVDAVPDAPVTIVDEQIATDIITSQPQEQAEQPQPEQKKEPEDAGLYSISTFSV